MYTHQMTFLICRFWFFSQMSRSHKINWSCIRMHVMATECLLSPASSFLMADIKSFHSRRNAFRPYVQLILHRQEFSDTNNFIFVLVFEAKLFRFKVQNKKFVSRQLFLTFHIKLQCTITQGQRWQIPFVRLFVCSGDDDIISVTSFLLKYFVQLLVKQ